MWYNPVDWLHYVVIYQIDSNMECSYELLRFYL